MSYPAGRHRRGKPATPHLHAIVNGAREDETEKFGLPGRVKRDGVAYGLVGLQSLTVSPMHVSFNVHSMHYEVYF